MKDKPQYQFRATLTDSAYLPHISYTLILLGSDSSVSIATRYEPDGAGIESQWGMRFYAPVQTGPGAHPASYTMGTGDIPGGVKRPVSV